MKNLILSIAILSTGMVMGAENSNKEMGPVYPLKLNLGIDVSSFDTQFITLPNLLSLDRVALRMKHSKVCFKTTRVEVSFDGESTQSFKVESGFEYKTYMARANTTARSIEVRNVRGCDVQIDSVTIMPPNFNPKKASLYAPQSDSIGYISYAYQAFKYVQDLVSESDRVTYVSPTLAALGKSLAVLQSVPDTSVRAKEALNAALEILHKDQPFIDHLLSIESTYQLGVEMMTVRSQIESMLK